MMEEGTKGWEGRRETDVRRGRITSEACFASFTPIGKGGCEGTNGPVDV
jgi:hypothetical protein